MFRVLVLLLVLCSTSVGQRPLDIIRAQWGSPYYCTGRLKTPFSRVVLNSKAGAPCNSRASCSSEVRRLQNIHLKQRGFCDIGYNFLIGEDGHVYEGRGWTMPRSPTAPFNSPSVGISFMGNSMNRVPSLEAQNSAQQLIACGVAMKYIKKDYVLKGLLDVRSIDCPGIQFYNDIKWPRFNARG